MRGRGAVRVAFLHEINNPRAEIHWMGFAHVYLPVLLIRRESQLRQYGNPESRQNEHALSAEEIAAQWVPLLRQYFASHHNSELALFQSQVLLILSGQRDLEPDGQWGPRTEAAFYNVSRTIVTIGFTADRTPEGVADTVINWMLDLTRAEILQSDLPD